MQLATIKNGSWRGIEVAGTFELVQDWKDGAKGGFVTVKLAGIEGVELGTVARVKCEQNEVVVSRVEGTEGVVGSGGEVFVDPEAEYRENETEAEAIVRIRRSFEILNEMTAAAAESQVRGIIVSGPPGIGKSFGVEQTLDRYSVLSRLADKGERYTTIKGFATAISLYQIFYNYRKKGSVIVVDDCDNVLYDEDCLNMMKAALDTSRKRTLSWNAESRVLRELDIPNSFEFEGAVIFLTNTDFDRSKSAKLLPHLQAMKSRCLYMNLDISNQRDILRRIRQIMKDGLLRDRALKKGVEDELYLFVEEFANDLDKLDLRTVIKLADLYQTNSTNWRELAVHTLMKPGAKWRLMKQLKDEQAA